MIGLEVSKNLRPKLLCQITILRYATHFLLEIYPSWSCLKCYLCPGNKRAQGDVNPEYKDPFVFVNDYSAVKETQAEYHPDVNAKGTLAPPTW